MKVKVPIISSADAQALVLPYYMLLSKQQIASETSIQVEPLDFVHRDLTSTLVFSLPEDGGVYVTVIYLKESGKIRVKAVPHASRDPATMANRVYSTDELFTYRPSAPSYAHLQPAAAS
ncbi:hypothetical protein FWH13_01390 [Candidatus Saccharibacteria bacterium]|nr:hypothetical protein [Candidatus Saccharibacteria bacterium]